MCGICGFTGEKNQEVLKKMTDTIFHRGPDEEGFFSDGKVNLGARRLSIIDLNSGHQPVHNEDKSLWAVFNGEIYNFQALRKELEGKGHIFYTDHSDTEVIVHLYEEYGEGFTDKMNGMFAIALCDKKRDAILLIRDRMGVKPLFYALINGKLIFGSEIKAIFAHPSYSRAMNYEGVYHYFTFKNIPAPMTAFKGIYSLLPGEMLTFSNGEITKDRWWKIRFSENKHCDDRFIKDKILTLLEDATRLRMVSDVPIGAYLSGGVDSSTVVALMAQVSSKPVKTFSLGYEDELKNKEADLYYARQVSRHFKTEHYEYIMSSKELIQDIDKVIEAFDQPFSGTISTFFLTKLIKKHVKVALSGDAADELFGSYLSHRLAQPMCYFAKLQDKIKANKLTKDELGLFRPFDIDFLNRLFKESKGSDAKWRYQISLFLDEEKDILFTDKFKSECGNISSFDIFETQFKSLTSDDPLNRILEMEWNTQLPDQVLAFVDFLSMAHSVEIRSPFLDYRLVEFAATIPGSFKIRNGNVKDIFKRSVEQILPEGITKRQKEGFVLPVFSWIEKQLEGYCRDTLSKDRLDRHGLLNVKMISDILNDYYKGNKTNAAKVWNLMMFQAWWERYFG